VLVEGAALRTAREAFGGVGFEMKRAEAAAYPMLVGLRDFAASGDFVANPNKQDACEKDEEGGENQPRELHPNHGAVEGRRSEPHWSSTNPQSAFGFPEGK